MHDIDSDRIDQAVLGGTIDIAQALGAREGVEHGEQLHTLRLLKSDKYQGFVRAEPTPVDEFEHMAGWPLSPGWSNACRAAEGIFADRSPLG